MSTDPTAYAWWLSSRAAGLAALVLATVAVTAGLMLGGRLSRRPGMAGALRAVHEHAALAALVAIAVHALTLLGDPWLRPGPAGIAVPFVMDYRPLWSGLGIIAALLAAVLGLSFYLRDRIGPRRWRTAHRATIVVWLLSVVHALGAGTDAQRLWLRLGVACLAAPVAGLFAARLMPGPRRRPAAAPTSS
ncbi:MAG TPA: ferric reductase-like transmembrane domain-containing protein [Solirubrobacteraceae bacterium]|nr:ferric reductase-like transmembrane domain-containing protein [Solirubrobacteraceae bacterium]